MTSPHQLKQELYQLIYFSNETYSDSPKPNFTQVNREIQKEILFRISTETTQVDPISHNLPDVRQDSRKKNKWWFKYPEDWRNCQIKDKVLGFRSMYLLEDWFDIQFNFLFHFGPDNGPDPPSMLYYCVQIKDCFVGRNQTLRDVCANFDNIIHEFIDHYGIIVDEEEDGFIYHKKKHIVGINIIMVLIQLEKEMKTNLSNVIYSGIKCREHITAYKDIEDIHSHFQMKMQRNSLVKTSSRFLQNGIRIFRQRYGIEKLYISYHQ
jgi:hypothetical protein